MDRSEWAKRYSDIRSSYLETVPRAASVCELETLQTECLGRKGALTELLKSLKDFPLEERKALGQEGNALKAELAAVFDSKKAELYDKAAAAELENFSGDLTLPAFPWPHGRLHPLTLARRRMASVLAGLGFSWVEGPYIEDEFHNFDALNTPKHHPARDMHDTLYLKSAGEKKLMRTHTSPVQIRHMLKNKPPIRVIAPGRVFRNDAVDASHSPVFHQIEGLYVDRNVSLADLKYTLTEFMRGVFAEKADSVEVRFRPSFFPFVEPGVEVDVKCVFCAGAGCAVCKRSGWVEMLGAGIVHPEVLKAVNLDPEEWSGFAFGIGVERLAMPVFGINDIRAFYENDIRLLERF